MKISKQSVTLKPLFFIIVAIGISLMILVKRQNRIDSRVYSALPESSTSPLPTVVAPDPIETAFMDSPDGTMTLTMEKQPAKEYDKYSFFTSVKSETAKHLIFSKEVPLSQSLSIPYNTWSPDNVYFFITESTPLFNNYYVFFVSGDDFPDNSRYVSIQELFAKHISDYIITDVTGWAAPNLLIVNTRETQGEKKVSFWFNVTNQSFTQLWTYFR